MKTAIHLAKSDDEIMATFPLMNMLYPKKVAKSDYLARVKQLRHTQGYRLAVLTVDEKPVCVAGFKLLDSLDWGRYLYVDDIVTDESHRSKGIGKVMLDWLGEYGLAKGCEQLHLDSGAQRDRAHKFYEREGMEIIDYHFKRDLQPRHLAQETPQEHKLSAASASSISVTVPLERWIDQERDRPQARATAQASPLIRSSL